MTLLLTCDESIQQAYAIPCIKLPSCVDLHWKSCCLQIVLDLNHTSDLLITLCHGELLLTRHHHGTLFLHRSVQHLLHSGIVLDLKYQSSIAVLQLYNINFLLLPFLLKLTLDHNCIIGRDLLGLPPLHN